jgi:hypothetical protein
MAYADQGGSGPFASSITWDAGPGHCSEFWVDLPEFDNALKIGLEDDGQSSQESSISLG